MNPQRNISGKELEDAITSDDVLGKKVIDLDGRFIGIAEKVFINPNKLDFVGISIDKGFLKKGFSIGKAFIERVASHAIFLKISVAYELRGLRVFDKDGKEIGKVRGIVLISSGNTIDALEIFSKTDYLGVGKKFRIASKYIDRIGYNVILNAGKDDLTAQK